MSQHILATNLHDIDFILLFYITHNWYSFAILLLWPIYKIADFRFDQMKHLKSIIQNCSNSGFELIKR